MAGVLDLSRSTLFPMKCDVYYATESQDKYGKVVKRWQFDSTRDCALYTKGDETNNKNFNFDEEKFYGHKTIVFGRMTSDVRVASDGKIYPLSHVLVTNIVGDCCEGDTQFFYEPSNDYTIVPTVFEVIMAQPFVGVFNNIEFFKLQLARSDNQEMN